MNDLSIKQQIMAGSAASIVSVLLLNPLVVLKIRIQDSTIPSNGSTGTLPSKTITSLTKEIYQLKGIGGFYAGTKAGLYQSLPSVMLYMTLYERLKQKSELYLDSFSDKSGFLINSENSEKIKHFVPVVIGGVSRFVSSTLTLPLELIRTIQAGGVTAHKTPSTGSSSFISHILLREYGFKSLYYGWTPTILRDCLFSSIYWGILESSRNKIKKLNQHSTFSLSPSSVTFLSASFGSIISATVTHPFDVIKTRRQLSAWNNESISKETIKTDCKCGSLNRLHLLDTIHCMLKHEGVNSLFRGLSLRLFTVVPGSAIAITVYEYVKKMDLRFTN